MSAECSKCGSDIVYPAGKWPLGECPVCSVKAERDAARALVFRFSDQLVHLWHNDEIGSNEVGLGEWMGLTDEEYGVWCREGDDALAEFVSRQATAEHDAEQSLPKDSVSEGSG